MAKRVIKYFQSPAFSAADWSGRNPYLNAGEIGYLLEDDGSGNMIATQAKVGPGFWNDLKFVAQGVYPYSDAITNPIGDVTSPQDGELVVDIIKKMISPYIAPKVTTLVNNLGGTFNSINNREIGESFSSPIQIALSVSNPSNLQGATPVNVNGNGIFTTGSYAYTSPIGLSIVTPPLKPSSPTTISIGVTLTHQKGVTTVVTTQITFFPRIMWTSSALSSISDGSIFVGKSKTVTNSFQNDYSFPGNGYSWLAIPSMLSPSGLVFTDVTDPNRPGGYSMDLMGTLVGVNNGVGTYNYEIYRSTYSLINSTILRVR